MEEENVMLNRIVDSMFQKDNMTDYSHYMNDNVFEVGYPDQFPLKANQNMAKFFNYYVKHRLKDNAWFIDKKVQQNVPHIPMDSTVDYFPFKQSFPTNTHNNSQNSMRTRTPQSKTKTRFNNNGHGNNNLYDYWKLASDPNSLPSGLISSDIQDTYGKDLVYLTRCMKKVTNNSNEKNNKNNKNATSIKKTKKENVCGDSNGQQQELIIWRDTHPQVDSIPNIRKLIDVYKPDRIVIELAPNHSRMVEKFANSLWQKCCNFVFFDIAARFFHFKKN